MCQHERSIISLCSGMATEVMVAKALDFGLQICGSRLRLSLSHLAACELNDSKRKFIIKRFPNIKWFFKDVHELKQDFVKDRNTNEEVPRPYSNILVAGFSCKDVSSLTTKPKSERGSLGSSANTLQGIKNYLEALAHHQRPQIILLENVSASAAFKSC